jgi:hypothetical protein
MVCERNSKELSHSIKRTNLMGIKEGEEVQAKGICNIFKKMIAENFKKISKKLPSQVYKRLPGNQTDLTKIKPLRDTLLSIKTTSTENREKVLKAITEKKTNNI